MNVFMIGGPGNISRGTVDSFLESGDELTVFTRNVEKKKVLYPGVRLIDGDRANIKQLSDAFITSKADIVIDTIGYHLDEAQTLYEIIKSRIKHFIFISTVDVYGYPLSRIPFRETDVFRPATAGYAQTKLDIELFYQEKQRMEGLPLTIGRPSLSIGPDFSPMMLFDWGFSVVPRIRAGLPILVPGDGLGLMHVGWSYDVGRMIARISGDTVSIGKTYTLSDSECITRDDYISLYTHIAGREVERVYIPQNLVDRFEEDQSLTKIDHLYKHNMAFSMDSFKNDFPDFQWLSLSSGVEEFIRVNDERGRFSLPVGESIEDRIIKKWKERLHNWQ